MYTLTTLVVFSLLSFIVGIIGGAIGFRQFGRQGKITQSLEERLAEAEKKYERYQSDVTEHFEETSRRVNTLTQNYKDVHEYLASSAMKLTNPQMSKAISQAAQQNLPHEPSSEEDIDNEHLSESYPQNEAEEKLEKENELASNTIDANKHESASKETV